MLTDAVPGARGRALHPRRLWRRVRALPVILALIAGACSPDAFLVADDDRDRDFQRARDAERLEDFLAAAEHYERALDRNPRLAAAHLGYATISQFQLRRYAEAVYHYQRYLRLRPNDPKAEDIRHLVTNCMERLATSVPLVIRSETIARDLEAVRGENQALRLQVSNLVATTGYWSNELRRLTSMAAQWPPPSLPAGASPTNARPAAGSSSRPSAGAAGLAGRSSPGSAVTTPGPSSGRSAYRPAIPSSTSGSFRYHRVAAGETMESIARRYGITGAALRRANPQIEPRNMRTGVQLRVPSR